MTALTDKEAVRDNPLHVEDGFILYTTMGKVNIYIKGVCDYRNGRKGAYSYVVTAFNENGEESIQYFSSRYLRIVKNNYAAEIRGLTDAIRHVGIEHSIDVFTNNQPLIAMLSEERYGYDYDDLLHSYWDEAKHKKIAVNWIKKSENNNWMQMVDKKANLIIKN